MTPSRKNGATANSSHHAAADESRAENDAANPPRLHLSEQSPEVRPHVGEMEAAINRLVESAQDCGSRGQQKTSDRKSKDAPIRSRRGLRLVQQHASLAKESGRFDDICTP